MSFYRTCRNIEVSEEKIGSEVVLSGWVFRRRDHGGVIFIDLRDFSGYSQIVFKSEISEKAHRIAEKLRSEYVITIRGQSGHSRKTKHQSKNDHREGRGRDV